MSYRIEDIKIPIDRDKFIKELTEMVEEMHAMNKAAENITVVVPDDVLGGLSDVDFKEVGMVIAIKDVISQGRHRTSRNKSDRKRNRVNRW